MKYVIKSKVNNTYLSASNKMSKLNQAQIYTSLADAFKDAVVCNRGHSRSGGITSIDPVTVISLQDAKTIDLINEVINK